MVEGAVLRSALSLRSLLVTALLLGFLSQDSEARVLSYSPVTDRNSVPAVQFRAAPHFVLIEQEQFTSPASGLRDRLVLYDSAGSSEPRVLYPSDASTVRIGFAAAWEAADGVLRLLISSDANIDGSNPNRLQRYLFSADGGSHWTAVGVSGAELPFKVFSDYGGALVRGNNAQVRLGTRELPFVVAVGPGGISRGGVFAVGSDGSSRVLFDGPARLLGSDTAGERFLIQSFIPGFPDYGLGPISVLDLEGNRIAVTAASTLSSLQGWITPGGAVYLLDTSP